MCARIPEQWQNGNLIGLTFRRGERCRVRCRHHSQRVGGCPGGTVKNPQSRTEQNPVWRDQRQPKAFPRSLGALLRTDRSPLPDREALLPLRLSGGAPPTATAQPGAATLHLLSPCVPLLPHGPPSVVAALLSGACLGLCG